MSTLEVACGRCDRRFRVRAEFAGRSTRCPGCSAPITVGAAARAAPPPRAESEDRPRPRPRPRDDDDAPRRPTGNWKPVDEALAREQGAALSLLATFVGSVFAIAVSAAAEGMGPPDPVLIAVMLLLVLGPVLAASMFGTAARVAALRAPSETRSKSAAIASLLCAVAALASVCVLGLAILSAIGSSFGPDPLAVPVAIGSALVAGLAALATFVMFVAQVGIARRSAEVSEAFGRTAVAVCVCVLGLVGISILIALARAATAPEFSSGGGHEADEVYSRVMLVFLGPVSVGVLLVMYHRLLAASRRAVQAEPAGRYDG